MAKKIFIGAGCFLIGCLTILILVAFGFFNTDYAAVREIRGTIEGVYSATAEIGGEKIEVAYIKWTSKKRLTTGGPILEIGDLSSRKKMWVVRVDDELRRLEEEFHKIEGEEIILVYSLENDGDKENRIVIWDVHDLEFGIQENPDGTVTFKERLGYSEEKYEKE